MLMRHCLGSPYLVDGDVKTLCAMLRDDPDVALIRADGPGRWKAQREIPDTLSDGEHGLWHIPSGPIVLESTIPKAASKLVKDPFRGWKDRQAAAARCAVDQHRHAGRHLAAGPPQGLAGEVDLQPAHRRVVASAGERSDRDVDVQLDRKLLRHHRRAAGEVDAVVVAFAASPRGKGR
jgi:hypothetical protein